MTSHFLKAWSDRAQEPVLNSHTEHTSVGRPYPQELGPCPPSNEAERLVAVDSVLQTYTETNAGIDGILKFLKDLMQVDSVAISVLSEQGTCLKQCTGILPAGGKYKPPGVCHWLLVPEQPQVMVVPDMLNDARTSTREVVLQAPFMRFYAAAPLITSNNHRLGSLCLWRTQPLQINNAQVALLCNLTELIMRIVETIVQGVFPQDPVLKGVHTRGSRLGRQAYAVVDIFKPNWEILYSNEAFTEMAGFDKAGESPATFWDIFAIKGNEEVPSIKLKEGEQSLTLHNVSCRRKANSTQTTSYSCVLTSLSADQLDEHAVPIGRPPLDSVCDIEQCEANVQGLYLVMLTSELEPVKRMATPIRDLQIGAQLGSGAYGQVFKATWRGRVVAAKVVHHLDGVFREDGIPLEAALLKDVRHPGIVRLFTHKLAKTKSGAERLWLLLQYCNRGPIVDAIHQGCFREKYTSDSKPCMPTILASVLELAKGVAFLHERGILHCDISGGNVMLNGSDQNECKFSALLCDFGMCRREGTVYPEQPTDGSFPYLAPEVIGGSSFSKESDVYSLGVLMWELYYGQRAWEGLNGSQITYAVLWNNQQLQVSDGIQPDFGDLMRTCLHKVPSERPLISAVVSKLEALHQQIS